MGKILHRKKGFIPSPEDTFSYIIGKIGKHRKSVKSGKKEKLRYRIWREMLK